MLAGGRETPTRSDPQDQYRGQLPGAECFRNREGLTRSRRWRLGRRHRITSIHRRWGGGGGRSIRDVRAPAPPPPRGVVRGALSPPTQIARTKAHADVRARLKWPAHSGFSQRQRGGELARHRTEIRGPKARVGRSHPHRWGQFAAGGFDAGGPPDLVIFRVFRLIRAHAWTRSPSGRSPCGWQRSRHEHPGSLV